MTLYPDGIDSTLQLPGVPGSDGYVVAINASKDAIIAVETELGLDPAGIYSDVATRLSVLEGRIGPGATITGGPIDINNANLTGVLDVIRGGTGLNLASAMANPNAALISTGLPTPGIAYSLISDVHIDPAAAIDVTKLAAGANTYVLTTNTGIPTWMPTGSNTFIASGDLSGTPTSQTVIGLQGTPVDATAPSDGYVLTYDLADGYWHAAIPSSSVADDIGKSGPTNIDRVLGIKGVALATGDTLALGEVWKKGSGSTLRAGKPVMPGHYDPRDYGAVLDGVTDDLWAFQAMHAAVPATGGVVQLPPGMAWLSDTWRISKPIQLRGLGGNVNAHSGFQVAPGKTALRLDYSVISLDGFNANFAKVQHLDLKSKVLVHETANGSAAGFGISAWAGATPTQQGACAVATANANPTIFHRASFAGHAAVNTSGVEPTWPTTLGATVVEGAITWTTEAFPFTRANLIAYALGERVYGVDDNRYVYECTTAGTSAAASPGEMVGDKVAGGVAIGGTIADGYVVWTCRLAAGIYINTGLTVVRHIAATGFTGAGIHVQGGVGQDAAGTTSADVVKLGDLYVADCGLGVYFGGSDSNAWVIDSLFGIRIGWEQPMPNAQNAGGHILHDHSDAGGMVLCLTSQTSTGRAVLKTGNGFTTFLSCYQELPTQCYFKGNSATVIGGTLDTDPTSIGRLVLNPNGGRGLSELDSTGVSNVAVQLTPGSMGAYAFARASDAGMGYMWKNGYVTPTGWWGMQYGGQNIQNAFCLSSVGADGGVGAGWLGFQRGHFLGDTTTIPAGVPLFRGHVAAIADIRIRGGFRVIGDTFTSGATDVSILTSDGYRATEWVANQITTAGYAPWAIFPATVEPTANTGSRHGGEQVWQCTTGGTTHATTEPTWPGSPTPGVTTVTDDTVVWTFLGSTPAYDVEQRVAKTRLPTRLSHTTTSTATASQVIESGGIVDSVDYALPPSSLCRITDLIVVKKTSTADGGTIEIKSDWVRNGTGAPTQIGASVITYNLSGATLDATTVAHVANGNRIELQASPESADALNWSVFRTQAEGVD